MIVDQVIVGGGLGYILKLFTILCVSEFALTGCELTEIAYSCKDIHEMLSHVSGLVKVDDGASDNMPFAIKNKRLIHYAKEDVDENKVDLPPGDQLGAAGLDRGFFSHLKKNWTRVMAASSAVPQVVHEKR